MSLVVLEVDSQVVVLGPETPFYSVWQGEHVYCRVRPILECLVHA